MSTLFEEIRSQFSQARAIVAFTGAGVAAESGIPTFRGHGGLWAKYPPSVYGTPPGLAAAALFRPSRLLSFVQDVADAFFDAEPNAGHLALGRLARAGRLCAVITQNIDDLHERGGAEPVIKLHGDLLRARCLRCKGREPLDRDALRQRIERAAGGRWWWGLRRLLSAYPRCSACGRRQRPDVVLFGESLPADQLRAAELAMASCDLLVISGTSGQVYPANALPDIARDRNVPIVEISPEPTAFTAWVEYSIPDTFAAALPRLVDG